MILFLWLDCHRLMMNGITHDLQIAPYNCSERDLAAMHLMKSKPEDLMTLGSMEMSR